MLFQLCLTHTGVCIYYSHVKCGMKSAYSPVVWQVLLTSYIEKGHACMVEMARREGKMAPILDHALYRGESRKLFSEKGGGLKLGNLYLNLYLNNTENVIFRAKLFVIFRAKLFVMPFIVCWRCSMGSAPVTGVWSCDCHVTCLSSWPFRAENTLSLPVRRLMGCS